MAVMSTNSKTKQTKKHQASRTNPIST